MPRYQPAALAMVYGNEILRLAVRRPVNRNDGNRFIGKAAEILCGHDGRRNDAVDFLTD